MTEKMMIYAECQCLGPGDNCHNCRVNAQIYELVAKVAELQVDATRYRWLRTAGAWESEIGMDELSTNPELFDATVDLQLQEPEHE